MSAAVPGINQGGRHEKGSGSEQDGVPGTDVHTAQVRPVRTQGQVHRASSGPNATVAWPSHQARAIFRRQAQDLEAQDKLGNFEIQDLMNEFNQAETLASSVLKKRDDTANAIIQKI